MERRRQWGVRLMSENTPRRKAEMKARQSHFKRYPELDTEWNNKIYSRAFRTGWNAKKKHDKDEEKAATICRIDWSSYLEKRVLVKKLGTKMKPIERTIREISPGSKYVLLGKKTQVMGSDGLQTIWRDSWEEAHDWVIIDSLEKV